MSILDFLMGGGGSMASNVKQNQQQSGILQMLGIGGTPGIVPEQQDPVQAKGAGDPYGALARWGAGVSKASGYSRMPTTMGQVMAAGNEAMEAGNTTDMDNQLKQAQAQAYGAKGMDMERQAQQIMMKKQMGIPLSPEEEAMAGTYDAFGTAKMQTITMPDGSIKQVPAQRPVFGQLTGQTPQGGGQAVRPDPMQRLQQLRQMKQQQGMQ